MEIQSRSRMSPANVLEQLEDVEELTPVQQRTLEHLKRNLAVKDTEALEELMEELQEIDDLKERHVLKVIETLPMSGMEVRTLFSKERIKLDDAQIDEIVSFSESVTSN